MCSQHYNIYFFVICFYLVINYIILLLLFLQRMCVLTVFSTWYLQKIVVLVYIGRTYIIMHFCCCFYCVMYN